MAESLRSRVGRIISVGVSSILNSLEGLSPEGMMEAAIEEVNAAVLEVKDELGRTLAARHIANKRFTEKNALHEELEKKVALAVAQSRDDLAEAGIAHQLDIEAQLPVLRDTVEDLNRKEAELNSYISALNAKNREMKEELAKYRQSLASAPASAGSTESTVGAPPASVDKKVFTAASAFERIMARQTGLPAAGQTALSDQAKLAELDRINRENRIKERLLAVKASRKA